MKKTAFCILGALRYDGPTCQSEASHRIFRRYNRTESASLISIEARKLVREGLLETAPGHDSLGRDTVIYSISEFGKIVFDTYQRFLSHWHDSSLLGVYWKWLSLGNRPALRKMFKRHSSSLKEMNEYIRGVLTPPAKKQVQLLFSPGRFEVGLHLSSFSQSAPQRQIKLIDSTESSLDLADRFQSGKATFGFMTLGAIEGVLEYDRSIERELIPVWIGFRESEAALIVRHRQESKEQESGVARQGNVKGNIYCTASKDRAEWASKVANRVGGTSYEIEGTTEDLLRGFLDNDFENIVSISPGTDLLLGKITNVGVIRRGSEPLVGLVSRQVYQEYPCSVTGILGLISSASYKGPDWKLERLTDYLRHFPDLFPTLGVFNPQLNKTILRAKSGKSAND